MIKIQELHACISWLRIGLPMSSLHVYHKTDMVAMCVLLLLVQLAGDVLLTTTREWWLLSRRKLGLSTFSKRAVSSDVMFLERYSGWCCCQLEICGSSFFNSGFGMQKGCCANYEQRRQYAQPRQWLTVDTHGLIPGRRLSGLG